MAAWLQAARTATTRQARLADTAAFLRWLAAAAPGVSLWTASEDVLVASEGTTPARPLAEATALLAGAEAIAATRPADAAAAALLISTGLRAAEVAALTAGRIADDSGHRVIRIRVKGGKTIALPLPPRVCALLEPLLAGRAPHEPLLQREDGRPFDRWRLTTALRRTARAAGVDPTGLTPHVLRATAATLLLDAGTPVELVQALLGHASPVTTKRYDRGTRRLDGHATYRLAGILAGGS